ncbi:MAG: hypothetical protein AAGF12_12525 [Myxococcota bacterium]
MLGRVVGFGAAPLITITFITAGGGSLFETTAHAEDRTTPVPLSSTNQRQGRDPSNPPNAHTAMQANAARRARVLRSSEYLSRRLAQQLDTARRERHRLRATCLDTLLSQVHSAQRVMSTRRHETPEAARSFWRIMSERLNTIRSEAYACHGTRPARSGETYVTVEAVRPPDDDAHVVNRYRIRHPLPGQIPPN